VPKSIASDLDGLSAMPFSQNQTCSELRHWSVVSSLEIDVTLEAEPLSSRMKDFAF